jgi:aldose 1-epimerase
MNPETSSHLRAGAPTTLVELRAGDLATTVTGGRHLTLASLEYHGRELLVAPAALPTPYRVHGARAGITLLHPWANRLSTDQITVAGRRLRLNSSDPCLYRDANGLAIHGLGSRSGWEIEPVGPAACRSSLSAPAVAAFPFAHRVDVWIELEEPGRLLIETTLTCEENAPVPAAFGWHPYFHLDRRTEAALTLPRRRRLRLDARGVPTGRAVDENTETIILGERSLDDSFCRIADGAKFGFTSGDEVLEVVHERGYAAAQVFAPRDTPVLSLEPMTAPTDGLRTYAGLDLARPGEPFSARFSIRVAR